MIQFRHSGYSASEKPVFAMVLGAVIALIGLSLALGGVWLAVLGGSLYYFVAGLALVLSGALLFQGRMAGVWLYFLIYVLTLIWAVWEVGLNGWALVPRVVAPTIILVLLVLILPLFPPTKARWTWPMAGGGVLAILVLTVICAFVLSDMGQERQGALPPMVATAMADPSLLRPGSDWPAYGGSYAARRYSPLTQITPDNVDRLEKVWTYHTGDMPSGDPAKSKYGAETTPLKVGNSLYLCSATNIMISLDAATGRQLWRYDPGVSDEWIPYTAACRGVSYYEVPDAAAGAACAGRVIEGTLDGRIIAVDARTGRPCGDFGKGGQVDMKRGLGDIVPGMVSITAPPTIVRGVIVTGHQVLDGQKLDAPSGVIQGFDAVTGEKMWGWDMTHPDWTESPPEGETYTRGTPNMWTTASGDEELGLVYLPLGNSAVDYWSSDRTPQANGYSTSLVALDVTTGKPRWHFQTVRKDVWDYDLGAQATLVDFPAGGGHTVPALILPSKQGDMYVLDRRTGQSLARVDEVRAPGGGVEPSQRAPTQPVSRYHTLRKEQLTERDMWGMSPIDQMICRIQFRRASYQGYFTPPTVDRRYVEYPGYNGGTDWGGIAVDPVRRVIVANYNDMPNYNRLVPREKANEKGWFPRGMNPGKGGGEKARGGEMSGAEGAGDPQWGAPYAIDVNAGWRMPFTNLLCKQPPYGGIRAIDMATGKTIWDRPFGTARRNGPFGIPFLLPITIGTPNNGGSVVTAGGIIFIAAATDDMVRAIDLKTGKTLWRDTLPAGGQATPAVYEIDGREYLVIMAGGHHFMETPIGDALVAYALPG